MVKNDFVYYHKLNVVCYLDEINNVFSILCPFIILIIPVSASQMLEFRA